VDIRTRHDDMLLLVIMMCLRQRLFQNAKSYGTMIMSNSPIAAELLAGMGYDYIILDHEHAVTDLRSGQALLQAMNAANGDTEPIVRLPGHDVVYMKKVLDSMRLPGGVLVPMIENAKMARDVVQAVRYPQQEWESSSGGIRGCAVPFVRASRWGQMDGETYMRSCRDELLVIVQVETLQGVEAIEDIAAVDGIDMIFLGPMDLSCSVGKMGNYKDAEVANLLRTAEKKIRDSPCMLGGFRPPGRDLEEMFGDAGYSLVCGSIDVGLLRNAARADVAAARDLLDRGKWK
jgi:4-hydroxy-2-oxoheptanedioate aldolase